MYIVSTLDLSRLLTVNNNMKTLMFRDNFKNVTHLSTKLRKPILIHMKQVYFVVHKNQQRGISSLIFLTKENIMNNTKVSVKYLRFIEIVKYLFVCLWRLNS